MTVPVWLQFVVVVTFIGGFGVFMFGLEREIISRGTLGKAILWQAVHSAFWVISTCIEIVILIGLLSFGRTGSFTFQLPSEGMMLAILATLAVIIVNVGTSILNYFGPFKIIFDEG